MRIRGSNITGISLVVVLIVLVNTSLLAQDKSGFIVKNSLTLSLQQEYGVNRDDLAYATIYDTSEVFDINFLNPAFMFKANPSGHHEIELSRFGYSNKEISITRHLDSVVQQGIIQNYNEKVFQLAVSYYYNHRLSSTSKSLEFYLGAGLTYATTSTANIPVSDQIYPWYTRKSNKHQLDLLLRPKMLCHLSDKFVLDINAGISLFQFYTHTYTSEGFIFTPQPEEITITKDDIFAQMFRMSVGIGYKL